MIKLPDTSTKKGQIEASILLCRLRNWKVVDNLYTASPSIAWEFASWIAKRKKMIRDYYDPFSENRYDKYAVCMAFDDWFRETEIYRFDLKVAKRMILDKVLELAIEAELIDAAAYCVNEKALNYDRTQSTRDRRNDEAV